MIKNAKFSGYYFDINTNDIYCVRLSIITMYFFHSFTIYPVRREFMNFDFSSFQVLIISYCLNNCEF